MLDAAEKAKIELNSRVENYRMQGIDDYDSMNITCEILRPYIGNTEYGLDYELTLDGYRQIMRPYLAPDLTIDSLHHMEALSHNTNNIIYPILDVLDKARAKLGTLPKIDAVLLNGGMSKLFAVRERIRDFFGFAPLEAGDPDLAVARGASVYHYWRQKGLKTPEIQNDDIGIAIQGGGLQKLITAGTVLPFTTEIYSFEIPEDGAERIDLPFYKGTRSDTLPPNRRIATRRIRFTAPQKAGTPIQLQGVIDEAGTMTLKVWREDEPEKFYAVDNVHTDLTEKLLPPLFAVSAGGFKKNTGQPLPESGAPKDIQALMSLYQRAIQGYNDTNGNAKYITPMKEIEAAILKAANCGEAVGGMARIMNMWRNGSERAALMLGRIARKSSPVDAEKAARYLVKACSPKLLAENLGRTAESKQPQRLKLRVQGTAILALSTLQRPQDEGLFIELLRLRPFPVKYLTHELCNALGRCGRGSEAVRELSECAGNTSAADRIAAYWGLGRVASRERPDKCPASVLEEVLPKVLRCVEREQHKGALVNGVYALGEMCDQRNPTERVSQAFALKADGLFEKLYLHSENFTRQTTKFIRIARSMIRGAALTSEDREILLKLREKDT